MPSNKVPVFIDGQYGTTGLEITSLLKKHPHIRLLTINKKKQKDSGHKLPLYKKAKLVVLCLPDDHAKQMAKMVSDAKLPVKLLDASTAHRTHPHWTYGFPELSTAQSMQRSHANKYRLLIQKATRTSNPGCYATAFISLIKPLIDNLVIDCHASVPLKAYGVSGYSGGGKKLIRFFKANQKKQHLTFLPYNLDLNHKHLPEMTFHSGLSVAPMFQVAVANFYRGIMVSIFLSAENLTKIFNSQYTATKKNSLKKALVKIYQSYYHNEDYVQVGDDKTTTMLQEKYLHTLNSTNKSNCIHITVGGNENTNQPFVMLHAAIDNLSKGAATQAVQNLNLMLGFAEHTAIKR